MALNTGSSRTHGAKNSGKMDTLGWKEMSTVSVLQMCHQWPQWYKNIKIKISELMKRCLCTIYKFNVLNSYTKSYYYKKYLNKIISKRNQSKILIKKI